MITRRDDARGSSSTATARSGWRCSRDDELIEIRAEREVILSAGAYQSPVLLMLSGIGPAEHLAAMGIDTRVDLPVGDNLQDHCMAQLNYLTDEPSLFGTLTPENFELLAQGRGPADLELPRGRGASSARAPASTRPTCSSTSARRSSSTRG